MIYGAMVSIGFPLETVMLPIYSKELFGERSFSFTLGVFASANTAGCAIAGPLINLFYEILGSYKISIIACAVLVLVGAVLYIIISRVARKRREEIISEFERDNETCVISQDT